MRYDLLKGFEYASAGQNTTAEFIEVDSPNNLVSDDVLFLDTQFYKVMNSASDNSETTKDSKSDDKIETKQFYMGLASTDGVNMSKCFDSLKRILSKTAKVDGRERFTNLIFDKMDINDTKMLLGWYIENFLYTFLVS